MNKAGVCQKGTPWKALNSDQVKILDNAGYEILRDVGFFIADEELLKMAGKMGGIVDFEKKIVKDMPEYAIRENVAKAPRNFVCAGRDPEWDLIFEGGGRKQFWAPESGATDHLQWDPVKRTYARRRANAKDCAYATKIIDGVDDFDSNCYVYDLGEEGQLGLPSELIKLNAILRNTTKFGGNYCTTVSDIREHDYSAKLAAAISGGEEEFRKRPLFWSVYNPLGTLQMNKFNSWSLRKSFEHHWPIMTGVAAAAPLVGPATAAANAAITHAGLLWITAMKGLYDPGTAVLNNNMVFCLDPFTGKGTLTSSHFMLGTVAMNQVWHGLYGLPTCQYTGMGTASLDQEAFGLGMLMMMQTLFGTDMIMIQHSQEALDPTTLVIAAEIAHYGKHFMSTFDQIVPTKENLALELAKQVGATGEGWMTSEFNMARIDLFYKSLSLDQTPPDTWVKQGSPSWCYDICREKLKEYEKHEPVPMPKDIAEKMDAIVKEGTELLKRQDGVSLGSNKPI